ncbi:MAG: hypothetical protein UE116_06255 [Clostridia bacterium]|jgi:riboflavin synthase|nr:hypothetical protein [Clostridia bacterium]DAY69895.1 MAG TPA: hypothetical protein [Caudoviricetes sp.]
MEYFILLAVIGILIAYIVIRETLIQAQIKELEEDRNNSELRAVIHFRKINEVENLIKEEQRKPLYERNNFKLVSKIKEVISNAN